MGNDQKKIHLKQLLIDKIYPVRTNISLTNKLQTHDWKKLVNLLKFWMIWRETIHHF